ncbi:MAG TPA: ABC transporter substrate-binding protein [Clostridia bacterium]|nr:ABC transporter substrate-binding protein [Clostridia bacterium]
MKKNLFRVLSLTLVLILMAAAFAGCAPKEAPAATAAQPQEEQKPKSDTLTMYSALQEEEILVYLDTFTKATGIKVNYVRLSAGEIMTRVAAEKDNPQASIWFGGPSDTLVQAGSAGLLEKYDSANIAKIPETYRDKAGFWSPIYVGAIGFACNRDWFEKKKLAYPESWEDLLKPEFAKQISVAHPGSSGTAYTILATMVQLKGEDPAFEYMKKLHKNVIQYTKSGSAPAKNAAIGEAAIGLSFGHDILKIRNTEGYPIELKFPKDGTGYEIGGVALIKKGIAGEEENARKFIDWITDIQAQELAEVTKSYRLPVNIDAKITEGSIKLSDLKTINYDNVWAGENRKRLVEKFSADIATAPSK